MFQVNAPGEYEYPAGVAVPTVVPGSGATQEGADAINACVRERAGVAQTPVPTGASSLQQTMTTQASGGVVTRTYTYGTPPAAAQSVAPAVAPAAMTAGSAPPAQCQRLEMRGGSGFACVQ
jgi:hypothetical protein